MGDKRIDEALVVWAIRQVRAQDDEERTRAAGAIEALVELRTSDVVAQADRLEEFARREVGMPRCEMDGCNVRVELGQRWCPGHMPRGE